MDQSAAPTLPDMDRTPPPDRPFVLGPWRALIGEPAWRAVPEHFGQVTRAPGQRLLTQGEPGLHVLVLLKGLAWAEQGVEHGSPPHHLRGPGDLLGEAALFDEPRTATVVALTDCRFARVPAAELRPFLRRFDPGGDSIAALLHQRQRIDHLLRQFKDPLVRLAVGVHPAVRQVDGASPSSGTTRLALSNEKVSRWLGVRPASILQARSRREFTENFASHRGALEILRRGWILETASRFCR